MNEMELFESPLRKFGLDCLFTQFKPLGLICIEPNQRNGIHFHRFKAIGKIFIR